MHLFKNVIFLVHAVLKLLNSLKEVIILQITRLQQDNEELLVIQINQKHLQNQKLISTMFLLHLKIFQS